MITTMPMQPPNYDFVLLQSPLLSLSLSSSTPDITTSTPKQHLHGNTNAAPLVEVAAVEMTTCAADLMMLKSNTTNGILRNSHSSSSDRIIASSLVKPLMPVRSPKQKGAKKCNTKKVVAVRGKATLHKPSSLSVLIRHQHQHHHHHQQQHQRTTQSDSIKKSVHFSTAPDQTRQLPSERSPLTPESQQQLWYQPRDYVAMDHDSLSNLVALHQVNGDLSRLHPENHCVRGLEMKTCPHIQRLRRLRAAIAVRAVLEAQHYYPVQSQQQQSQSQKHSLSTLTKEEALASVSRCYSQQARNRAQELGLIDSIESQRAASSLSYHCHGEE